MVFRPDCDKFLTPDNLEILNQKCFMLYLDFEQPNPLEDKSGSNNHCFSNSP